jgi:hypothetical protein
MQQNRTESHNRPAHRYFIAIFVLILVVAAALRLWGLPGIPPGPHNDEAANGILAAEIADGVKTPIFIPSYTGKEVLFFYGVAAFMRLLDAGMLALRLTAALAGLLTVAATLWLVYELFADDDPDGAPWLAALTAALLATSFWHVLLSRLGFRAITQPLLQALALAALWRGLRKNDWRWLVLGGVFFGLTAYTYLAARAFPIPLVISLVVLLALDAGRRRARLAQYTGVGLAALASFAPLGLYFARHPDAFTNRVSQVGPAGDWGAVGAGLIAAFEMLFLRGDPYIRFNLPLRPLFDPIIALLFIAGIAVTLWRLFRPPKSAESPALERARETLLLTWLPVMLLPTALAVNEITPSNLRAVGLIPLVFIFPARGLWALLTITQHAISVPSAVPESRKARLHSPTVQQQTALGEQDSQRSPALLGCGTGDWSRAPCGSRDSYPGVLHVPSRNPATHRSSEHSPAARVWRDQKSAVIRVNLLCGEVNSKRATPVSKSGP